MLPLLLGLAIGLALAWLAVRRGERELRTANERFERDLGAASERELEQKQRACELECELRDEANRRAVAETVAESAARLEAELAEQRDAVAELRERVAALTTELENERRTSTEKLEVVERARDGLRQEFRAASAEALKNNSEAFLAHAEEKLARFHEAAKGDLEKREQAIDLVLKPVRESLEKVGTQVQELEKARSGAYAGLTEQVKSLLGSQEQLRAETATLVKALRQPHARGQWGELQLKRAVELAGMVEHCDFELQVMTPSPDGALRPDLIVRLPGSRRIVVDAKVPLAAYLDAMEATDDGERKRHLEGHARHLRTHIEKLGKKRYWEHVAASPEFVVVFVPSEGLFQAALEQDPSLIEFGVAQGVIPATPTTLIALLRTAHLGWREEALAENAKHVSDLGAELFKRLSDMTGYFSKVGTSLDKAVEFYNKAVGSYDARVLVAARRFTELGTVPPEVDIDAPELVDKQAREFRAIESELESEPEQQRLGFPRSA
jgi:DNA recombination protein RmuC